MKVAFVTDSGTGKTIEEMKAQGKIRYFGFSFPAASDQL